ncbi:MAG TPA: PEP-CTERM sorting domain-containing protein [Tepidisphaeraceae bacterium]|jgi:hypothetical protein|nr:PEP-CTERM sorting domain-containing protein [Tepidisphaeraceae bacterium]
MNKSRFVGSNARPCSRPAGAAILAAAAAIPLLAQWTQATPVTWAGATELNGTLTPVTGGWTYSGTTPLEVGDAIEAQTLSTGSTGLANNALYYVTADNSGTYTFSASAGGATPVSGSTGTVGTLGVYSWNATAASGVQNGASWTGAVVPNGTDAVATISTNTGNTANSLNIAIQQNVTIGTLTSTQNKQWSVISSNLGTSTALATLTFSTTNTLTPSGPVISSTNALLRLGFSDASFHNGNLDIAGTQGLTLIAGTEGDPIRLENIGWTGFTNGGSGMGTLTIQQGQIQAETSNVLGSGTGALNVMMGNASSTGTTTATNEPELQVATGTVSVNNLDGIANSLIDSNGAYTLTIGTGGGTNTGYAGTFGGVSQTLSLIKAGIGTQILSGSIVGAGTVTVSGGTLILNGTNSYTGLTTVSNTGTLGGTGTITGSVTIATGATLQPGVLAGDNTLTTGAVSFGSGTNYFSLALNSTNDTTDMLLANGAVTLGTGTTLSVTDADINPSLASGTSFVILDATGGLTGTFTGMPNGSTLDVDSNDYTVNYSADEVTLTSFVPEPSSLSLLSLGACSLLTRRRRRRTRQTL